MDYFFVQIYDPNGSAPFSALWTTPPIPVTAQNVDVNTNYFTDPIFLSAGDTIQMRLTGLGGRTITIRGTSDYNPQVGTGWQLFDSSAPLAGADVIYSLNAPDYKQIDFLRDVLKMHGAVVIPDRNVPKKLYIEPLATFIGTGATQDWTGKVDTLKDIVRGPTTPYQHKTNWFTYKAGGEYNSQQYVNLGRTYGDYRVDGYKTSPTDIANEFAQGENKVELVMASTPCSPIGGTNIIIPKFIKDNGEFVAPGARALFNAGTATVKLFDDDSSTVVDASVFLLNHYSVVFPGVGDEDLNFAPEDPIYQIAANPIHNLFTRFYRRIFSELYSADSRVMTAHFNLNITDITSFTFADQIFIKDSYWRILEISGYNVGANESTQVTLMKIVEPTPDCELTPVSVSTGGIVAFVDAEGDPSTGSESCCTRAGYYWIDGRCNAWQTGGRPQVQVGLGTTGIGINQRGPAVPQNTFAIVSDSDISADAQNSIFIGQGIEVAPGNHNTAAVGDALRLVTPYASGAAMFGRNAVVSQPGFHLGGGWQGNDRDTASGRAQFGIIQMSAEGDFTNSTTDLELLIEGITGNRINLLDGTTWNCLINVTEHQITGGAVTHRHNALFMVMLTKDGGTAKASSVTVVARDGTEGDLDLSISIPGTDEQLLLVRLTGASSYPYDNCYLSASLIYTQIR
jgi:hypothetical protein